MPEYCGGRKITARSKAVKALRSPVTRPPPLLFAQLDDFLVEPADQPGEVGFLVLEDRDGRVSLDHGRAAAAVTRAPEADHRDPAVVPRVSDLVADSRRGAGNLGYEEPLSISHRVEPGDVALINVPSLPCFAVRWEVAISDLAGIHLMPK